MLVHLYGLAGSGKTTFLNWFERRQSSNNWSMISLDTIRKIIFKEPYARSSIQWFDLQSTNLIYESVGVSEVDYQLHLQRPDMLKVFIGTSLKTCFKRVSQRSRQDFDNFYNYSDVVYVESSLMSYEENYLEQIKADYITNFEDDALDAYLKLENYLVTHATKQVVLQTQDQI